MQKNNEQVLFEALVRQAADGLHLYLRACTRDEALVEEVFQDTLVVAWKRIGDYDSKRPFGAWTRGIATRIIRAKWRERALSPSIDTQLLDLVDARLLALEAQPGDTLDEKLASLRACVQGLSERDRFAIKERYEQGLRGAALAESLQTSLENARKTVQRARARVLACMQSHVAWE